MHMTRQRKQTGSGQSNVGGLGRGQRVENPPPGNRQLVQVVPNVLCPISLGSRAGVQGLDVRGLLQKGWAGISWIDGNGGR